MSDKAEEKKVAKHHSVGVHSQHDVCTGDGKPCQHYPRDAQTREAILSV